MKKCLISIVVLLSMMNLLRAPHMRGQWIAHMLFAGEVSSELTCEYQDILAHHLDAIFNATLYQDVQAAYCAIQLLEKDEQQVITESAMQADENFDLFIINQQKAWFNKCAEGSAHSLTFLNKVWGIASDFYARFMTFLGYEGYITIPALGHIMHDYALFERNILFHHYQATLHWLQRQKQIGFPTILMFWREHHIRHQLLARVKQQNVTIKPLSLVSDVSEEVLVGVDAGETVASEAALQESVESAVATDLIAPLKSSTISSSTSETMETDIDAAIKAAADDATAVSATSTESAALKTLVGIRSVGAKALDTLWSGLNSIKQSVVNFYKGSFVSKAVKTIADTYQQFIEAPYKKYVYDTLIAPLENNPLNAALKTLPHYLKMPIDITIQLETMQGGGLVPAWVDQANATLFQHYADQNNQTTEDFKKFQATLSAQQTVALQKGWAQFVDALNGYISVQKSLNDIHQLQLDVMSRQLLKIEPQSYYLDPANTFALDEEFTLSSMYNVPALSTSKQAQTLPLLPGSGAWYNVFRRGNWQYIADEKTFYQVAPITPLQSPDPSNASALTVAQQVEYSTIFTEYYPQKPASGYTVVVAMNLSSVTYPFFAGVLCNQARWVSGVPDRIRQQRFVGLYGAVDKTIYAVIVESTPATQVEISSGVPSMKSPFYLLTNSAMTNFTQQVLVSNTTSLVVPARYLLTITTTPTQVSLTLLDNSTQNPVTINLTKSNMSPTIFNFHGVGLVSAGAAASFNIQKPADLGFTQTTT